MKNKKLTLITVVVAVAAVVMLVSAVFLLSRTNSSGKNISRAEVAKMVALACTDDSVLGDRTDVWYERYVKYVNENGYMNISEPTGYFTYGDLQHLLEKLGKTQQDFGINDIKYSKAMEMNTFVNIFVDLIGQMDKEGKVSTIKAGIVGTPSNSPEAKAWQAFTTKGVFNFEGLILDNAIDRTTSLIVKGQDILCVQNVEDTETTYKNVWVIEGSNDKVKAYVYGVERTFTVKKLSQDIKGVLADVHMSNKKVTGVDIKTDTIQGRVLAITDKFVEIEGYGKVELEEDYKIYNNYNGFQVKSYQDIIVGYDLQDFIVANGKICGAVISHPLEADDVRILIKTTDFDGLFHGIVTVTSPMPFTLYFGEQSEKHGAGEVLSIDKNSPYLAEGRVRIEAENDGGVIINSIMRSQGNPSYEGTVEISTADKGLLVINDISIEKYLKRVVPSEMPVSFGVEALKVQAVCARSYAYKQLTNSYYAGYGAHMDDSTLFQVYNNINESENSNKAIAETEGQVLTYNGEVVETYYYSTSCGYTTDVSLWGSSTSDYPYFASRSVSQEEKVLDLANEEAFASFIKGSSAKDYDKDFPLYRWKWNLTVTELSSSFNTKLGERCRANPSKILTQNAKGEFVSKDTVTVGSITGIEVNNRVSGGAITSITVTGTEANVKIEGESHIRHLLGVSKVPLSTTTGELKSMASMPSTFCIFEPVYDNKNALTGFTITGGGYGHGIGMSQNAVYAMTNRSMNYKDILKFFYSGTEIGVLEQQ